MSCFKRTWSVFVLSHIVVGVAVLGLLSWGLASQAKAEGDEPAVAADDVTAPAQDAKKTPKQELKVKAETKAGPYKLTIDRVRFHNGTAHDLVPNGFPLSSGAKNEPKMETMKKSHQEASSDGQTGTMSSGSVSGGGGGMGGGFGGAYTPPNLILDLGLKGPKLNGKQQWLCNVFGKFHATDDQGRTVEGSEFAPWMKIVMKGVEYRQEAGRTAIQMYLPPECKDAKYLQSLTGELLVAEGTVNQVTFSGSDLSKSTTKRDGEVSAKLEKVNETPEGVEVSLAVIPPKTKQLSMQEHMSNPEAAMKNFMLSSAPGRVTVTMLDTAGNSYSASGSGNSGGGGGGGGSWGTSGGTSGPNGSQKWNSSGESGGSSSSGSSGASWGPGGSDKKEWGSTPNASKDSNGKKTASGETFKFSKLPEGAKVKSITCTVTNCTSEPKSVPFTFEHIPLNEKESKGAE